METNQGIETFFAGTRQAWRQWLKVHGESKKEVCLIIYHKKSKIQCLDHNEAVEEALCFGWIDSKANKRDEESYYQRFSPRRLRSNWSKTNVGRAKRMIKIGLMTENGLRLVNIAIENEGI